MVFIWAAMARWFRTLAIDYWPSQPLPCRCSSVWQLSTESIMPHSWKKSCYSVQSTHSEKSCSDPNTPDGKVEPICYRRDIGSWEEYQKEGSEPRTAKHCRTTAICHCNTWTHPAADFLVQIKCRHKQTPEYLSRWCFHHKDNRNGVRNKHTLSFISILLKCHCTCFFFVVTVHYL